MERIKKILKGKTSEISVNGDIYSKIGLNNKSKMLPTGDINKILNINEQFNKERNQSDIYRIIVSLTPLMSNVLMNTTGVNSLAEFSTERFRDNTYPSNGISTLDEEDLTFRESLDLKLIEKNGWFGYEDPNIGAEKLCEFTDIEPSRDKFFYLSSGQTNNWISYITYPFESVSEPGDITFNGLLITDIENVNVGGRDMIAFGVPINHGLTAGDTVMLSNISSTIDGEYEVTRLGLNNGDKSNNYFCVDIQQNIIPVVPSNTRVKRLVGKEPSQYYFRKFKKITTIKNNLIEIKDSEFYRLGFAQSIYEDSLGQLSFTEDLSVEGLVDNLGRPLSEVFFTIIKTKDYIGENYFSEIKSGLDLEIISGIEDNLTIPDINRIHNGINNPIPTHIPLESDITDSMDEFIGDIVEYNRFELREKVLSEVKHRFNTLNRESGGNIIVDGSNVNLGIRQEGYTYKPFYNIKIREFSNYIEQGDINTVGIPEYATNLNDGRFIWRDLLDKGFSNNLDSNTLYPFLNGSHYIHVNVCHILNRQDPFGNYGLLYDQFPKDPFGDRNDRIFEIKNSNDDC